jgi:hypothetical protein
MIQRRGRGAKNSLEILCSRAPHDEPEQKQPGFFLIPVVCYFVLSRQMATQNITQHREVKWLIQNLRGPCNQRTVCALFNVAGGSPAVFITTGMFRVDIFAFSRAVASSPFIPGRHRSIMMRSGCMLEAVSMTARPVATSKTSWPRPLINAPSDSRKVSLPSAINIFLVMFCM